MKGIASAPSAKILNSWAQYVEAVSSGYSEVPRSLSILRDIDNTLGVLKIVREAFEDLSSIARKERDKVNDDPMEEQLDEDGAIQGRLFGAQTTLSELHRDLRSLFESLGDAATIQEDDGRVEEATRCINTIAEFHNDVNALRWAIAEHDAACAEIVGKFDGVEDLAKFLNRKRASVGGAYSDIPNNGSRDV